MNVYIKNKQIKKQYITQKPDPIGYGRRLWIDGMIGSIIAYYIFDILI